MRKTLGAIAATALVAVLVAPAGAAGTKSGCKGKWTDGGVCSFEYKGGGFSIAATGVGGDPATVVSVRLEAAGPVEGTNVVIMSCGVSTGPSGAPAACASASSGGSGTIPYEPELGAKMTCTVIGNGTGKYRCSSGE